jgi:hypothetical protein
VGDPDENRRVLDVAGLEAPALSAPMRAPFAGFGTLGCLARRRRTEPRSRWATAPSKCRHGPPNEASTCQGRRPRWLCFPPMAREQARRSAAPARPAPCVVQAAGAEPKRATEWARTAAYRVGAYHIRIESTTRTRRHVVDICCPGPGQDNESRTTSRSRSTQEAAGLRRLKLLVRDGSSSGPVGGPTTGGPPDLPLHTTRPMGSRPQRQCGLVDGTAILLPPGLVNWNKQVQTTLARRGIVMSTLPTSPSTWLRRSWWRRLPLAPPTPRYWPSWTQVRPARAPYVGPGRFPIAAVPEPHGGDRPTPALGVASAYGWSPPKGFHRRWQARLFERVPAPASGWTVRCARRADPAPAS